MDISYALGVFNITDISKVSDEDVRKKYRKLMKVNHPDVGGSEEKAKEIIEANNTILNALKELKRHQIENKSTDATIFINLGSLINIFNGESITVGNSDNSITVNRSNINAFKVMINIDISIMFNGIEYKFSKFELRNHSDNYSIVCKYLAYTFDEVVNARIMAYGKDITINIKDANLNMNLTFDNGIRLKVMLERQLINDE